MPSGIFLIGDVGIKDFVNYLSPVLKENHVEVLPNYAHFDELEKLLISLRGGDIVGGLNKSLIEVAKENEDLRQKGTSRPHGQIYWHELTHVEKGKTIGAYEIIELYGDDSAASKNFPLVAEGYRAENSMIKIQCFEQELDSIAERLSN